MTTTTIVITAAVMLAAGAVAFVWQRRGHPAPPLRPLTARERRRHHERAYDLDLFMDKSTRLQSALVAVIVGLAVVSVVLLAANGDRVDQINAERARNTTVSCQDTNDRHDKTITAARQRRPPLNQADVDLVVALVDALAPVHRDCNALAASRVKR